MHRLAVLMRTVSKLFTMTLSLRGSSTIGYLLRCHVRHQLARLSRPQPRPVPRNPRPPLHRRHRTLPPASIQRAMPPTAPAVLMYAAWLRSTRRYRRRPSISTNGKFTSRRSRASPHHLALSLGKQCSELAFHLVKDFTSHRARSQCVDLLDQSREVLLCSLWLAQ